MQTMSTKNGSSVSPGQWVCASNNTGLHPGWSLTPFRMNILWKMSKVAFREIVTMRTVQPLFKQGVLERLICPPKEHPRQNSESYQDGAMVPAGGSDSQSRDPSITKQMLHQGRSIDQISNSVNHLQDTMSDLKHSFTALRIELNGPSRNIGDGSRLQAHDFDMIATVLKELKSKSEEIEKLKLEIEALKLKNRYMGVAPPQQQDSLSVINMNAALPEVRSPGLLQAGRKRTWPDAFPIDRHQSVADSFDEDDMVDEFALSDSAIHPARVPLNDRGSQLITNGYATEHQVGSAGLQVEISGKPPNYLNTLTPRSGSPSQSIPKRPRLNQGSENSNQAGAPAQAPAPAQRRPGRPRKSISQPNNPNTTQSPNTAPPSTHDDSDWNPPGTLKRRQSRRSLHEQSLGPTSNDQNGSEDTQKSQDTTNTPDSQPAPNKKSKRNTGSPNGSRTGGPDNSTDEAGMEEKRKAKVAARDVMAKMALQHEEALESGNPQ